MKSADAPTTHYFLSKNDNRKPFSENKSVFNVCKNVKEKFKMPC